MQEVWVQSLGWDDLLEKEMATHSSILAWEIPWTEEPGGLQSTGSQRVRHDLATEQQQPCSAVHHSTTYSSRPWKQPRCPSTHEWMKKL